MSYKGIDISSNNGSSIDFAKVKAFGIEIVYIKATQGTSYTNPYLSTHYNDAKSAGLKIGFYHYTTTSDATAQAKYFLNAISGFTADCKYCIDIEDDSVFTISTASSIARIFADYLISQGKTPVIYTGDYFYRDVLNSTVKDITLWVACYDGVPMANIYAGLQYSEEGLVSGVSGYVDIDWFDDGILLSTTITTVTETSTFVVPDDNNVVPTGSNITALNGGCWFEYVTDGRSILHFSKVTYLSISSGGVLTLSHMGGARALASLTQASGFKTPDTNSIVPTGSNISALQGAGWFELTNDGRLIWHLSKVTYFSISSGGVLSFTHMGNSKTISTVTKASGFIVPDTNNVTPTGSKITSLSCGGWFELTDDGRLILHFSRITYLALTSNGLLQFYHCGNYSTI